MIKGCERIVYLTTVTSNSLSLAFRDISTAKLAKVMFLNGSIRQSKSMIPLESSYSSERSKTE